jgi:hypothetical protein
MRSWGHFVGMLSPKFWFILRREGMVRTLIRAKPYKYSHEKAGWKEVVRLVGQDEFGNIKFNCMLLVYSYLPPTNRYYEDFDHHSTFKIQSKQHQVS